MGKVPEEPKPFLSSEKELRPSDLYSPDSQNSELPPEQPRALPLNTEQQSEEGGMSWIPIAGYNPVYRLFLGGGFFYSKPSYRFGIHGVVTFDSVYQVMQSWENRLNQFFRFNYDFEYSKGFEPYYGDGGETKVADGVNIWGDKFLVTPRFIFSIDPFLDVGFFIDARNRGEHYVEGRPQLKLFPNETTIGLGVFAEIDKRDHKEAPTAGFVFGGDFTIVPSSFTTRNDSPGFTLMGGHFAIYQEMVAGVIAAVKLSGGVTFGTPTYLWKYRLGGTDLLRGYYDNRFRGKKFYLQQTELRAPLLKFLELAGFVGFGDATDHEFTQAKMAYGIGARIGLPPDFVNKIRIDYGVGRDQSGVFVDFGYPF